MEVHHHSHTERKKWTHYLWEFIMLFFAVFCGFLAEYLLEHKIEKDRAAELAKNLYDEVYADSIVVQEAMVSRLIKEKHYIDFAAFARDSNLSNPALSSYKSFAQAFQNHKALVFEPKDGILNQLVNSGSLRYFRSKQLQTDIGALSVVITKIRARNARENTFLDFTLRPFQLKHFDNKWIQLITENGKLLVLEALERNDLDKFPAPKIIHADQFDRYEAENIALQGMIMSGGTRSLFLKEYAECNHNLLMTLRKEYHLK